MKFRIFGTVVLFAAIALMVGGCTDWEKKYKALEVEHENLKGLYENCKASLDMGAGEKAQYVQQLSACQQELEACQSQLEEAAAAPSGSVAGLEGVEHAYDPATGDLTVTLPTAILFDSGKASLKGSTATLDQVVGVLRNQYSGNEIDVVGHTDTDPIKKSKWEDNWQLSTERALSVVRYLQKRGLPATLLRACGAGQYRPRGPNKAQNRRVEIVVHTR